MQTSAPRGGREAGRRTTPVSPLTPATASAGEEHQIGKKVCFFDIIVINMSSLLPLSSNIQSVYSIPNYNMSSLHLVLNEEVGC